MATIVLNKEIKLEALGKSTHKAHRPVYDLTTKVLYASRNDAAEALGTHASSISKHLHGCVGYKAVKGHKLCEVNEIIAHLSEIVAVAPQETKPSPYERVIQNKRYLLNASKYISEHKAAQQELEAKLNAKKEAIRAEIIKCFELAAQTAVDEYELIRSDNIDPCLLVGEELIEAMRVRGIKYDIHECDEYRALKGE